MTNLKEKTGILNLIFAIQWILLKKSNSLNYNNSPKLNDKLFDSKKFSSSDIA